MQPLAKYLLPCQKENLSVLPGQRPVGLAPSHGPLLHRATLEVGVADGDQAPPSASKSGDFTDGGNRVGSEGESIQAKGNPVANRYLSSVGPR